MKSAPFTKRGSISSRGVACEMAGVGNLESGGREEVNFQVFGRSARVVPEEEERWAAIWTRRLRGIVLRVRCLASMQN